MTDPNEALAALDASTERYEATKAAHDEAREDTINKVIAALKAGATPTEVANRSPFTGAHVRTIARGAAIPAAPPGIKPRRKV